MIVIVPHQVMGVAFPFWSFFFSLPLMLIECGLFSSRMSRSIPFARFITEIPLILPPLVSFRYHIGPPPLLCVFGLPCRITRAPCFMNFLCSRVRTFQQASPFFLLRLALPLILRKNFFGAEEALEIKMASPLKSFDPTHPT